MISCCCCCRRRRAASCYRQRATHPYGRTSRDGILDSSMSDGVDTPPAAVEPPMATEVRTTAGSGAGGAAGAGAGAGGGTPPSEAGTDTPRWLVISDVDNTVLGSAAAVTRLRNFVERHREHITLVYSSGRSVASIRGSIESHGMPEPDWMVGSVGTEVARAKGLIGASADEPTELGTKWAARLGATYDAAAVRACLEGLVMESQPKQCQTPLKTSYYCYEPAVVARARELLAEAGLGHQVVYSANKDVDVLPAGANKRGAAEYLVGELGMSKDHVICCGDSGNDREMLSAGWYGVVVANHQPELADLEGPRIHRASASFADGVVEGLSRWTGLPIPASAKPADVEVPASAADTRDAE